MTEIGYIIQSGESIPDDVLAFADSHVGTEPGVSWTAAEGGYRMVTALLPGFSAPVRTAAELAEMFPSRWPLTVTAVRQPERKVERAGWPEDAAVREPEPQRKLIGPPHAHWDAPCTDACYEPAAEPSVLLDLVRQYGDAREEYAEILRTRGNEEGLDRHATPVNALFGRIAALVPQESDLIARVMAELGVDRPEDVLPYIQRERRLLDDGSARFGAVREQRDDMRRERDDARANADDWKRRYDMLAAVADPLVLSLPTVPDGAVGLIASNGVRWLPGEDGVWRREDMPGVEFYLGQLLDSVASATVVMREPRTWDALEPADEGMTVRGASGNTYVFRTGGRPPRAHVESIGDRFMGCWMTLGELREVDGPLTEVFDDEPGGETR